MDCRFKFKKNKLYKTFSLFSFLIVFFCLGSSNLYAACTTNSCCTTFMDGVQSNTSSTITFTTGACSSTINATGVSLAAKLPGGNVTGCSGITTCNTNHGAATCVANACETRGGTITLTAFPALNSKGGTSPTNGNVGPTNNIDNTSPAYKTVSATNATGLTFTGGCSGTLQYYITTLTLNPNNNTTTPVSFAAGCDYYIDTLNITANNVNKIINATVTGSGTARLFVNSAINVTAAQVGAITINNSGTANQLLLVGNSGITLAATNLQMKGVIYSPAAITLTSGTYTGAASGTTVTVGGATAAGTANVTYDFTNLQNLTTNNFGGSGFATCNPAPYTGLDTLTLSMPTTGSYCSAINATVTAVPPLPPGGATDPNMRDKIAIDTNNGTCTNVGGANCFGTWTLVTGTAANFNNFGGNNGYAEYTYSGSEPTPGQATFALTYPGNGLASPVIKIRDLSQPTCVVAISQTVNFKPANLAVTSVAVPTNGPIPAGYSTAQTAGTNFSPNVILTAVTNACGASNVVNTSYTGAKNIKICPSYVNPATGTLPVTVNGSNTCTSGGSVTFASGTATLSAGNSTAVNYKDVGNITITATDTASSVSGTSGTITVKPASLTITSIPSNPAAANSSGSVFTSAGTPFTVTLQARESGGSLTPNYNLETPAQGFAFSPVAVSGGGNNLGTLAISTAFTANGPAGQFQGALTYSEVGIIQITTTTGQAGGAYLSDGTVSTTFATNVGRFTPAKFAVALTNSPAFASGCSSGGAANAFTYLGQPLTYTTNPIVRVTAQSATGTTTTNYTNNGGGGSYAKLTAASFNAGSCGAGINQCYAVGTGQPAIAIVSAAGLIPSLTDNTNGTLDFTFNPGTNISYTNTAGTNVAPFNAAIQLQLTVKDTDNITYPTNPFTIGAINPGTGISFTNNSQIYQGRLFVNNVSGSELVNLSVPMAVQYYTGSGFTTNTKDSCSALTATGNVQLTPIGAGVTTSVSFASTPLTFASGVASFTLTAPGAGNTGSEQMTINLATGGGGAGMPWLQFNWPMVPGTLQNPTAVANFGLYGGPSPKIIYQRSIYP